MRIEVLIATMHNDNPNKLYKDMNLSTDAIIINQCDSNNYKELKINDNVVKCYSFNERGLSRSRNNALLRCTGDILCLADDDVVYSNTYKDDIVKEFENHPKADAIVFNVLSNVKSRSGKRINKFAKVGKMESREYGSVHIAIKRNALLSRNVYFNILFGSGSTFNCGEDTIFLKELLDKKLKLYKSPVIIGNVDMSDSTWFKGYTKEYFNNKGAVIACAYPHIKYLLIFIQSIRNSKKRLGSYKNFFEIFDWYCEGVKNYNKYRSEMNEK